MRTRILAILGTMALVVSFAAACTTQPAGPSAPVDTQPPKLLAVQVTPVPVAAGQQLTIYATVSDNVGVSNVTFLVGRNGQPSNFCSGSAVLNSGTPQLGEWMLKCLVPGVVNAGVYELGTAAFDSRLNSVASSPTSSEDVARSFIVSGDTNDLDAPVVDSVVTSPASPARGSSITISAHVTDATGTGSVGFAVRRAGTTTMDWCLGGGVLVSGTATDGYWEMTCQVGAGAPLGAYRVNTLVTDVLGNFAGVGDGAPDEVSGPFTVTAG